MHRETFADLPGWEFQIQEVSLGVYDVTARDAHGREVHTKGTDLDALIGECKAWIAKLPMQGSDPYR